MNHQILTSCAFVQQSLQRGRNTNLPVEPNLPTIFFTFNKVNKIFLCFEQLCFKVRQQDVSATIPNFNKSPRRLNDVNISF